MASLSVLNYLNILAYAANAVVTYGVGTLGWFGASTNSELSQKYQTLVTPAGFAFAIWGIIFLSQLIWAVAQLINTFSNASLVKDGVKSYYVGVCIAQIAWTIVFSLEYIRISLLAMLTILLFLLLIVKSQYQLGNENITLRDYWLLKFPFEIHAGWILAASFVNLSVVLVQQQVSAQIQFYVALASLLFVLVLAAVAVAYPARPNFCIPLVLAWATLGIYFELKNPKDLILTTFDESNIRNARAGALFVCISIVASVISILVIRFLQQRRQNETLSSTSEGAYLRADEANRASRDR